MATYRLEAKIVARSKGYTATASAAYRAAERIEDERTGQVFDYTRKRGVLYAEILAPEGTPAWMQDRVQLWNAVEKVEKRKDAQLARDLVLSLPHELTHHQRLALVREFVGNEFVARGMIADIAIHAPDRRGDERNHHAHVMLTMRELAGDGFGKKVRDWNATEQLETWREHWAEAVNRHLERHGHAARVDHRSLEEQGVDREPEPKLGPIATEMEREGRPSHAGDDRRAAQARNEERAQIAAELEAVAGEIIDLEAEREKRAEAALITASDPAKALDRLTERRATFTRAELMRELAYSIGDPAMRGRVADSVLACGEVVGLREHAGAPVTRYTTREVLAAERQVLRNAGALAGDVTHGLADAIKTAALARHAQLSDEQRAAFEHVTGAEGFTIIAGEAGTGKSTTLAAVRDGFEAAGCRVIGMAWTNAVVQDMRRDGFGDSTTIAAELKRLEHGSSQWDRKTVLVVDEAAMLSTRNLAAVTAQAREAGAKLILVGDDQQLASIERGGMFGALRQEHGAAELHDVHRVSDADQKRAFNLMHKGEFKPALEVFEQHGAIHWTQTQDEAIAALVGQWAQDSAADPDKARFVFAYTNADVDALNRDLRAIRRERGELGDDHTLRTKDGPAVFAEGDRIQFTGNATRKQDKNAGLVNGSVGTIQEIDGACMTVTLDGKKNAPPRVVSFTVGGDGQAREFDAFRHGYAGTIYKGQGRTLDQTYLYHSKHWRAASSYVALTRHRESADVFVAMETAGGLDQLARQMARVDDRRAASQFFHDRLPEGRAAVSVAGEIIHLETERMSRAGEGGMENLLVEEATRRAQEAAAEQQLEQARRDDEARQERAKQVEQQRQQEAQQAETHRVENDARENAEHQARQAEDMQRQRDRLDRFEADQRRQADEARQEEERKRQAQEQGKAAEGDIRDAGDRYREALGRNYDMKDPYGSLARSAMAEYEAFIRDREKLTQDIAREQDPEARKLLELRRDIEAADYMAITDRRIAKQGEVINDGPDNETTIRHSARAAEFETQSQELRQEYRDLAAERAHPEAEQIAAPGSPQAPRDEKPNAPENRPPESREEQTPQPSPSPEAQPGKEAAAIGDQPRTNTPASGQERPLMVEVPGRGPELLTDVAAREHEARADEPEPREISPAEFATSAEARRAYREQQATAREQTAALEHMGEDIKANRHLSFKDLQCLSREDLKQIDAKGDDHLREMISSVSREQGRQQDYGGREREQ